MKLIITIFLWGSLSALNAQSNAYEALIGFNNFKPQPFEYEHSLCPWQSFRHVGTFSYQIDLVADSNALRMLQYDNYLFVDALKFIYEAYPLDFYSIELIRRWDQSPGQYKIHIPGLSAPYNKYFSIIRMGEYIDITKQGYAGWYYQVMKSGIGIAVKKLGDNSWQVSAAIFLKGIVPSLSAPIPELEYKYSINHLKHGQKRIN